MNIKAVHPESPLFGYIRKGWQLKSINGHDVIDTLDYQYKSAEDSLKLIFISSDNKRHSFDLGIERPFDLGIKFEDDKVLRCEANCIFCFVHQQPKGMRRSLYVKDDDFRLSFKHGNFVTLSNFTEKDIKRVINQRLAPLYISVHATDNNLRRCLLRNEKLKPIVPLLKRFIKNEITFHTQVVVCPGVNDGEHLEKTIEDLARLYPGVMSVGIVPVGLTKYRQRLTPLKTYDSVGANGILDLIENYQSQFFKQYGSRLVFAADEFYVLAKRDIPKLSEYEEMEQFENGIGMLRWTITQFNRRKRTLVKLKSPKKIAILTGYSAFEALKKKVVDPLKENSKLNIDIYPVKNKFWGDTVTVSGLLTGQDILNRIKSLKRNYDTIILPPNCINDDGLFLDDMTFEILKHKAGVEIMLGSYFIADSLKKVLQ